MFKKIIIALMAIGLSSGVAIASDFDQNGVSKGTTETSIFGAFQTTDAPNSDPTIMLGFSEGNFVNDNLQIGADVFWVGSGGASTLIVGVFGKFHFNANNPKILPYVGGKVGLVLSSSAAAGSTTEIGYSYGLNGGVKMFQAENASMNVEAFYEPFTVKGSSVTNSGVRFAVSMYK